MENPAAALLHLTMSNAVPRCLLAITDMGVADALDGAPRTAADLAATCGCHPGALNRALRILSAHGVFASAGNDGFVHTPASQLLRADHPQSMRSFVRMLGFSIYSQSMEKLDHSIKTGESALKLVVPEGQWAYFAQHPELSEIFDHAMTGKAHGQIAGILSVYDFSPFKTIADIGGGQGHLLEGVLRNAPQAAGVLFDLPHVAEQAATKASPRLSFVGGDFFKDPLPVCDAYLIMQVIHDWGDKEAAQILTSIRRAAPAHAKLLVIEAIVPDDPTPNWIAMLDIYMLALFGGKERTRQEFESLFSASGFRLERVVDVGMGTSILEASVV